MGGLPRLGVPEGDGRQRALLGQVVADERDEQAAVRRGVPRVENALDRRYEEVLHFPARGRTVWIGASYRGSD